MAVLLFQRKRGLVHTFQAERLDYEHIDFVCYQEHATQEEALSPGIVLLHSWVRTLSHSNGLLANYISFRQNSQITVEDIPVFGSSSAQCFLFHQIRSSCSPSFPRFCVRGTFNRSLRDARPISEPFMAGAEVSSR